MPSVYSGPYSDTDNGAKKFVVNVTSNDPVYYYCSVQKHCEYALAPVAIYKFANKVGMVWSEVSTSRKSEEKLT